MEKNENDGEKPLLFENKKIYNNGLIQILKNTLDLNNKILELINENKKTLEEAKKHGRTEP